MKIPILILGIIFLISFSSAFSCYQESANTTNQSGTDGACGQLYNGSYTFSGVWADVPPSNGGNASVDGNYNTESLPAVSGLAILNSNYTKPSLANSSSIWQVRYMNTTGQTNIVNYSLPSTCFSTPFLDIRSQMSFADVMDFSCWNGTAYQSFYSEDLGIFGGRTILYEEGVFWEIGCGTINQQGEYVFSGNLSTSSSCLTVSTSNVTINCNGHILESLVSQAGNFLITSSNQNNLTVKNCKLKWLTNDGAVGLSSVSNANILNNTMIGQVNDLVESTSSSNILIANNTMIANDANRTSRFVFLSNTNNVQILNNQINPAWGCTQISLSSGNNWTISNNILFEPTNFSVGCAPDNSIFINSTLTNSTISNNNVSNFSLLNSNLETSNITGNLQNGTDLHRLNEISNRISGSGNLLRDNRLYELNNTTTLLHIFGNTNQIFNNEFTATNPIPILVTGTGNSWNTSQSAGTNIIGGSNIGGNFYSTYTGRDCNADGIGDTTYTIAISDIDYLPLTNDQSNCGGGGGGGSPTPTETPTTPEPTPTVEEPPPTTQDPQFYETPPSGYPSQSAIANDIKEALPSLGLDILPFKCEAYFTKANIAQGEFFDKIGCEYRGILALYKTGTPLVNGNAIILGASVFLVVLTSKKFDFVFLGSFALMVFVLATGFDFLLYSLTALTIIIGGGRV